MRSLLSALALSIAFAAPAALRADSITTGSAGGFSGSGTITTTTTPNFDGSYTITDISGTGITGLIGSQGFNNNDNHFFPNGASLVDGNGFSFTDVQGNTSFQINLFSTGSGYQLYLLDGDGYSETLDVTFTTSNTPAPSFRSLLFNRAFVGTSSQTFNFTFAPLSVSPTPEPSALLLFGTGLLGAVGASRARKRR